MTNKATDSPKTAKEAYQRMLDGEVFEYQSYTFRYSAGAFTKHDGFTNLTDTLSNLTDPNAQMLTPTEPEEV